MSQFYLIFPPPSVTGVLPWPAPFSRGLTVDGKRHLLLSGTHPGDHGSAQVLPSVLLFHRLQRQSVLVAEHLCERESERERERERER